MVVLPRTDESPFVDIEAPSPKRARMSSGFGDSPFLPARAAPTYYDALRNLIPRPFNMTKWIEQTQTLSQNWVDETPPNWYDVLSPMSVMDE